MRGSANVFVEAGEALVAALDRHEREHDPAKLLDVVRGTSPRLRGVSVRGSLPAWDICWGGRSGPFLSARIAYLQENFLEGWIPE